MTVQSTLAQLYHQHATSIVRYLQRNYGFGPPDPEDIVQDVFTKFGEAPSLEQIENPKAYLYKMAINFTLNAIKRQKHNARHVEAEQLDDSELSDDIGPELIAAREDEIDRLNAALHLLTDKQKEILIRSRLKGQTYAQISRELGWSQADICRQLYLALSTLQQATQ